MVNLRVGCVSGGQLAETEYIDFEGHQVQVRRRPRRKSLSISVHTSGEVRVAANRSISQRNIVKFLAKQKKWIETTVIEMRDLRAQFPQPEFCEGSVFPLLGHDYPLAIVEREPIRLRFADQFLQVAIPERKLELSAEKKAYYLRLIKKNYKQVAAAFIGERVQFMSKQMQLFPRSVHFRGQKTIWGSCTAANGINLNYKLIVAPLFVIDYVIIHELAHITHKNHSKHFWGLVEEHTPHRQAAKLWLQKNQLKTGFLDSI